MRYYQIVEQTDQDQIVKVGLKMKDTLSQYQAVIQPHSETQYMILVLFGGLLLALVSCFYIYYNKNGSNKNDSTARERRDTEENNIEFRYFKERFDTSEKKRDSENTDVWRAISKINDQYLEIHSIVGEIKGMLSSRRIERDNK